MRVVFTGSREASGEIAEDEIHDTLDSLLMLWEENFHSSEEAFILVHGDARGADQIADKWARGPYCQLAGVQVEKHPYWREHGLAGGPLRNRHMISLGADYVVAYIKDDSLGASGCVRMAHEAGIPDERIIVHREYSDG